MRRADLAELYRVHSPGALRLAYVLVGDNGLAQDLVHDAFVRVSGRFTDLRGGDHFEAYLRKTIVNLAKNHHRKRSHEREYLERHGRTATESTTASTADLRAVLLQLPERQRAALALRYLEDLSEHQTAEVMDISVAAVKSLVQRAMATLREKNLGDLL